MFPALNNACQGRIQDFLQGGVQLQARIPKFGLGVDNVLTEGYHPCAPLRGSGVLPKKIVKPRCSEMRFQANPDGQVKFWCKMILSCYVRHVEV
jgi:hypothetical protein